MSAVVCLNSGVSHVSDRVTSCRAAAASPVHCGTRDDACVINCCFVYRLDCNAPLVKLLSGKQQYPGVAEESGGLAASALWTAKASIGGIITLDQSKK